MTRPILVAMLPRADSLGQDARLRFESTAAALGLAAHACGKGAVVVIGGPGALGPKGAVAGDVFAAADTARRDPAMLCEQLEKGAAASCDCGYWGDYLTLTADADAICHRIQRSPFGSLPCFWMEDDHHHILVATSVTLLEAFTSARLRVDWHGVATFLLAPQLRNGSTCLEGVRELPAGFTLEVGPGWTAVRPNWSPWDFACSAEPLTSLDVASTVVRDAIDQAIASRCGHLGNPVLFLSGGLDSSTVAASLAHSGHPFSALTMVTRHRSGDERTYARAVAEATGAHLTECFRATEEIDWDDRTPRRLSRPSARIFRQPSLRLAQRLADECGADTILDGAGGDDVFCSLSSVVPLLDRMAVEGLGRGSWRTARDIALRADVDILTVLGKAFRRSLNGRVAYRWLVVTDFLTPDTLALADEAVRHPWLDPPPGTLPGQAAHVALVLDALGLSEDDSLGPDMRTLSPLVAQPVVEAALRVRSWLWFENGRNRAVIRHGLTGRLPQAVIERTGKGTPGGFVSQLVEDHRTRLREMLLGGKLVAHGVADPIAIEAALTDGATIRGDRYGHLLVLADAERWAQLWS
jgi:asparagine synthase (glutamine-hydrolysing)